MKNKWNEAWKDLFSGLTPEEEKDKNYLIEDEEEEQALLPGIGGGPAPEAEEADQAPFPNLITDRFPQFGQVNGLPGGTGGETENYLTEDGKNPQNDLLPGIGGDRPNISRPLEQETATESETDRILREALELLTGRVTNGTGTESAGETILREAATGRMNAADELRANATEKGNTLYDALMAFAGKQDTRYDSLLSQISEKGYRDFAGVSDILSSYAAQGDRAAGYAAAGGAMENGGNPDSYAAAQAARQRLAFTDAGNTAALQYYNDQLDRWLSTIEAAGRDGANLYGLVQDNVDSTHAAATEEGGLGESLFSSLADLQKSRTEGDVDAFSALLSHYSKVKGEGGDKSAASDGPSPMEIDREFERMTTDKDGTGAAYSSTDALIKLWKKYPSMQAYILEKYQGILNPEYEFKG